MVGNNVAWLLVHTAWLAFTLCFAVCRQLVWHREELQRWHQGNTHPAAAAAALSSLSSPLTFLAPFPLQPKIHPNDRARFVFDRDAHTLHISVNDAAPILCFSGLPTNDVFAAVAFYGSSSTVRAAKVRQLVGMLLVGLPSSGSHTQPPPSAPD